MELVDRKTGELYDGFAVTRKKNYSQEFNTMFRAGWEYLASLEGLAGRDYRVLHQLLVHLDYENWISISQETLAQELNLKQPNVAKSISKLLKYKVIERERDLKDRRRWQYRFNADLGWKGDANQWKKHQNQRIKKIGSNIISMPGIPNPS